MAPQRQVRLFRNGRNQAVKIPREFELPGDQAVMHKDGERLLLEPVPPRPTLRAVLESLQPVDPELDGLDDLPPDLVGL